MPVPLRTVLFRLHWALGLTAGLVLAVVGVTGAMMSYEEAIVDLANADRARIAVLDRPHLGPEALVARLGAQRPGLRVSTLTIAGDPAIVPRVRFADDTSGARPPSVYLDPYDGTLRGEIRGEATFATIRGLHRWLLLPGEGRGWGRTITGAAAVALLAFLATGLYLRWPKVHAWRIWLRPSLRRPGRPRYWSLHAVAGTWLLPVYAVIALTGLWWSYEPYRSAATRLLTGKAPEARADRAAGRKAGERQGEASPVGSTENPLALDRAWAAFRAEEGASAALATVTLPGRDATRIRIRWIAAASDAPKARNESTFDAATGARLSRVRFSDEALGRQIAESMLEVHRGRFFGGVFALVFCLAALMMPLLAITGLVLYVLRRRAGAARRSAPRGPGLVAEPRP
ncbi:PepSY domain-containing protein [Methylobacterium sp. E-041]|uniref:PepSY-associated TM helix domain-containing protein n=1 Tax=unclassified Methylobacterium TaxID=2615210 RepID=UPI001FBC0879|nr:MULTISPECIES: PepSY-associated TM helix domain-containing protein [unclassified Methylobacterium]MCJ2042379.1 PepSY domain-containing protein [Methylobacterium sp. J-059]MCJ2104548.1 PepSY domain-containing protein [Methylobacterium sp. E-041]MCJ2114585.1 PepSY domain-containing protein [Methylobacterium sp. E-025]